MESVTKNNYKHPPEEKIKSETMEFWHQRMAHIKKDHKVYDIKELLRYDS